MAQNHLLRRGSRYFFRRRVPRELREIIGKNEIKKALGTSDRKKAARLATIETLKSDELFESKRKEVQQGSPPESLRGIGYGEAILLVARWYRELEDSGDEWLEANLDIFQKPEELRDALETCHLDEHVFSGGGDWGWGRRYQGENGKRKLLDILKENGVEFSGTNQELLRLASLVRKGYLENARNDIKRLNREQIWPTFENHSICTRENLSARDFSHSQQESAMPRSSATVGKILDDFCNASQ